MTKSSQMNGEVHNKMYLPFLQGTWVDLQYYDDSEARYKHKMMTKDQRIFIIKKRITKHCFVIRLKYF